MSQCTSQPITLTWKNLSAAVKEKTILSDCTGYCKPGDLLAIMGPSGSGKTTLLSLLSYKYDKQLTASGKVLANNVEFNAKTYYNFGAYVYQNDVLYPTMTVRQTLTFIAKLKFIDPEESKRRVSQLISQFQLQKCADHLIGTTQSKGISGGEKKRVCIAIEMVSKPSLVILDEPTSGLDSNKAARVLKVLKKLAKQGHSIIFTIHQPSFLLYSMLNRVIVLNGGQTIYQGLANQVESYLQNLSITISKTSTICDFFMLEISQYKRNKDQYQTPFSRQNYEKQLMGSVQKEIESIQTSQTVGYAPMMYKHGFFKMFSTLLARQWITYKRNSMKIFRLFINYLTMSALISLVFFNSIKSTDDIIAAGDNSPPQLVYQTVSSSFIQAQSSCYINIISALMVGIMFACLQLPMERPIFYKQQSSKLYTIGAYFASKVFIEVTCVISGTLIYTSIVYWVLGFDKDPLKFILFSITIVQISLIGNSIGFFLGSLFRDPKKAIAMTSLFILPMSMMSGLWNKLNFIPLWIGWLQYISPFKYALQMLVQNQYRDFVYNRAAFYNYKEDLDIQMGWMENCVIILGLATMFYTSSLFFLIRLVRQVSV